MKRIYINPDWTFKEVVENIEVIKSQAWEIIASFSCLEIKEEVLFKRDLRRAIYSFKFEEWRCDRILEYIYDDISEEKWKNIATK